MANLISPSDFYDDICEKIAKEIALCTPQLFSVKNQNSRLPPKADSSSLLVTVNNRFFLTTAAHSVHDFDLNCIGIMIENDFCTIGGQLKYFEPNELENFDPNKIDIAVFELEATTVSVMKEKYQFLQWNKIGLNHISSEASHYLIFGYPEQETKKYYPTKQILPSPFILRTIGVTKEYYFKESVDITKTVIVTVDQKMVVRSSTQKIEVLPELGGISGCGVWNVFNLFGETPQYQLVSILTGENEEKTVLYSSKINVLRNILISDFKVDNI